MNDSGRTYKVFLSAAEASGDNACANLIKALKQTGSNFEFVGFGGDKMAQAGCELVLNTTQKAAMTYKAFAQVLFFIKAINLAKKHFAANKPDLVVVCDSPSFNFHIAKAAGQNGVKVFFYVAPQLWAWAPWRLKKLKRLCTASMACVLPFEPDWFGQRGLQCNFVGSPVLENIDAKQIKPKNYSRYSISAGHIALMPGSRPSEIKSLWPAMQHIARRLKARHPSIKFTAVAADDNSLAVLKKEALKTLRLNFVTDAVYKTACNVDFALVASGSATLQVAAAACPMVIMYQSNKYLWEFVGKRIVTTKYLSLVNILSQQELVPEFMPYFSSIAPVVAACEKLLNAPDKLTTLSLRLAELIKPLSSNNASQNTTKLVLEQLNRSAE
ncbi:MAG: lipid-A-disaccharide synthase [Sedimentisphaerales bacterium]|nr:lipid-A-disaccharide synthase [Sedimentisphaerales bacterium]